MQGYDLDDTLAAVDFTQATHRPLQELFASAPVIYRPTSVFIVLTGRPHATAEQRAATTTWLRRNQPRWAGHIHYVDGGEISKAERKAVIIKRLQLSDYTDNNPDALAAIAATNVGAQLWHMSPDGRRTKFGSRVTASDSQTMKHVLWTIDGRRVVRFDGTLVSECACAQEAVAMVDRLCAAVMDNTRKQCAACAKRETCACADPARQCAACGKKECSGCGDTKQCAACSTRQHAACGGTKPSRDATG